MVRRSTSRIWAAVRTFTIVLYAPAGNRTSGAWRLNSAGRGGRNVSRYSIGMPTLRQMAAVFFRIGNTTLGGGDPTIAILQPQFDPRRSITPQHPPPPFG